MTEIVGTTADTSLSVINDSQAPKVAYKYILIEVKDKKTNDIKILVRGSETAKYHSEILEAFNCNYISSHRSFNIYNFDMFSE